MQLLLHAVYYRDLIYVLVLFKYALADVLNQTMAARFP